VPKGGPAGLLEGGDHAKLQATVLDLTPGMTKCVAAVNWMQKSIRNLGPHLHMQWPFDQQSGECA
jgi:hypothetical protein